ncbi:hypothetical protein [Rhizobium sp. CC-YZS058]|uniref:hypothetical protein n=1 Tax=Rhizobium sp. CC-YZS058 TaxID=3042153 RepID=UPI002B058DD2|nr:hypothetical protein [Rhizobium sp. CC-YZS058]MEA3537060.1 hypothetical protein [Rhizobium sp. CC-YZS058]
MDVRLFKQVRAACNASTEKVADGLVGTIVEIGGDPLTVRKAKDRLSAVLQKARNGVPQLVGGPKKGEEMAVVISVRDLAELVVAARQQETLGEALDAIGFKPYRGAHILVGQSRKRERLKRSGDAPSAATAN